MLAPFAEVCQVKLGLQRSRVWRFTKAWARSSCLSVFIGQEVLSDVSARPGFCQFGIRGLQAYHLRSDSLYPCHQERESIALAIYSRCGDIIHPHVCLVEHVPRMRVSIDLVPNSSIAYASQCNPIRFRMAVSLALFSRSVKVPLPAEVSIHS